MLTGNQTNRVPAGRYVSSLVEPGPVGAEGTNTAVLKIKAVQPEVSFRGLTKKPTQKTPSKPPKKPPTKTSYKNLLHRTTYKEPSYKNLLQEPPTRTSCKNLLDSNLWIGSVTHLVV